MQSKIASIILGISFVALISYVNAFYFQKFEPEFIIARTGNKATSVEISTVVDRIVTMLMALSLGAFVLAGFGAKIILECKKTVGWFSKISLAVFLIMQTLSLSFGYSANMSTLEIVSKNYFSSDSMQNYLSHQAFFLVCGLGCLIIAAAHFFLECSPTPRTTESDTRTDAESGLTAPIRQPKKTAPPNDMQPPSAKDKKTEPR